jgi:hypothetical protein
VDKTQIANYALNKVGEDPILLLTDDTKRARILNRIFDQVRDAELRRTRWKFSLKRDQLLALVDKPNWGFAYRYPLPADFLGLVQVNDIYLRPMSKQTVPWAVEQGEILTNLPAPLKVRYISRITNPGLFDPLFVEVLACKLAMEIAEPLTQSETKRARAADEYKFALSEAKRQDAIETAADEFPWGSWLDSRNGETTVGGASASDIGSLPSGTEVI